MDQIIHYSQSLGLLEAIGILGFILYISAFAAVQWHLLNGNSVAYSLANVTSSILVSISLLAEFNLSAALIQGSVIVIGVTGLALRLCKRPAQANRVSIDTLDTESV